MIRSTVMRIEMVVLNGNSKSVFTREQPLKIN